MKKGKVGYENNYLRFFANLQRVLLTISLEGLY